MHYPLKLKIQARKLRSEGFSYGAIVKRLRIKIPKATLAHWLKGVTLTQEQEIEFKGRMLEHLVKARVRSVEARRNKILENKKFLEKKNSNLTSLLKDPNIAKITLGILYLAEGSKNTRGNIVFGNSDPAIVSLFLRLLRSSYNLDESKFRCTVQARADQDIKRLERFWSGLTSISRSQFYKARIDPRSVGKTTLKKEYKGVCRIDYFSATLLYELMSIGKVLTR